MSTQTALQRAYNFSAGPAVLPESVLEQIQSEMMCLPGVGASILEISHRGGPFGEILRDAQNRHRQVFSVPDDYEILFLQGGACLQNSMIPANLLTDTNQTADYIITGAWGNKSSQEVHHFGKLHIAWDGSPTNFSRLPDEGEAQFSEDAVYVHITSNETIHGVQFQSEPDVGERTLVADMSSDILSRPIDIAKYGLIYACAQKNSGVAGLTVVIIRRDLMQRGAGRLTKYLDYSAHAAADSMANTPPTFAIYVSALVCRWLQEEVGGLEKMQRINQQKSQMLYDVIDASQGFYQGHARKQDRSKMNVVFATPNEDLDKQLIEQAAAAGMITLKGHRSVGGIRASIYNAMPLAGVQCLAQFMTDFATNNG